MCSKNSGPGDYQTRCFCRKYGVGVRSVVHNSRCITYPGFIIAERVSWMADFSWRDFLQRNLLQGLNLPSLIVGDSADPGNCIVYQPVERVFHTDLPEEEKFLSFERLWEIYEEEQSINDGEDFYNYFIPEKSLIPEINAISLAAYSAVKGKGYGRIDLRMDKLTKKIYVLEVNAQCGLSDDENYTSIGAILRFSNESFPNLVTQILLDALKRKKIVHQHVLTPIKQL